MERAGRCTGVMVRPGLVAGGRTGGGEADIGHGGGGGLYLSLETSVSVSFTSNEVVSTDDQYIDSKFQKPDLNIPCNWKSFTHWLWTSF